LDNPKNLVRAYPTTFLLASILVALYATDPNLKQNLKQKRKTITIVLISGTLLGLAIFAKIPVMAMIPLVGFILYSKTRNFKILGLWLIPVLLIPAIWLLYAITEGEFNEWMNSTLWQIERENSGLFTSIHKLFNIDPILILVSFIGFVYAAVRRRDLFLVLWIVPFLIFNFVSGYILYWHLTSGS
jgi:4-amino-4-deoxy-L-arabinose transferase-like glycosyltransferase